MHKQRDILIIPIPYTDLSSKKKRPVIVLSNNQYNTQTEDIIVAAITSNIKQKDYSVIITTEDMEEGLLPHKSMIRVDKIYTLNQRIAIKKFGVLKETTFRQVKELFKKLV